MRKLIQLSPSTNVVSLPAKWVKRHNLAKGDELHVQELENQLIISTQTVRKKSSITIDLTRLQRKLVWARCDAAYIAGHDEITFLFSKDQESILDYVKNEMPGMMITTKRQDAITFSDITAGKAEEVVQIITRVLHMISDLIEQARDATKRRDWQTLSKVKENDYVINSYVSYAQRQINRFGFEKTYASNLIVTFLKLSEIFADQVCVVASHSAKRKVAFASELEQTLIVWRQIVLLYLNYSEAKLIACEKARSDITTKNTPEIERLKESLFDIIEVVIQVHGNEDKRH